MATSPMAAKNFDIPEGCEDDGCAVMEKSEGVAEQANVQSPTNGPSTLERRKRLISTSLTKTPVMDGDLVDYHNHRLKSGYGEFDLKYNLYAVVVSRFNVCCCFVLTLILDCFDEFDYFCSRTREC